MNPTLFVAWQNQVTRDWFPIGRLSHHADYYEFVYTQGVRQALQRGKHRLIPAFETLETVYQSPDIFPIFANRLLPPSRPDYGEYIGYLDLERGTFDPIVILGISGGSRVTDAFELFPYPVSGPSGFYRLRFLVHGLRHLPKPSHDRVLALKHGETLCLQADFQNPHDPKAMSLRSDDSETGGRFLIGYVPRFLCEEISDLLNHANADPQVKVVRVNPPPAPLQLRLLCEFQMRWPKDHLPFSSEQYQPIPAQVESHLTAPS